MTERERLINIIENEIGGSLEYYADTIADKLLANGVIVPPCKVGDTVYQIANGWRICESKITWFYWDKDYKRVVYDCNTDLAFSEEAIGKSVFLTKEEAEKALEEMKKE